MKVRGKYPPGTLYLDPYSCATYCSLNQGKLLSNSLSTPLVFAKRQAKKYDLPQLNVVYRVQGFVVSRTQTLNNFSFEGYLVTEGVAPAISVTGAIILFYKPWESLDAHPEAMAEYWEPTWLPCDRFQTSVFKPAKSVQVAISDQSEVYSPFKAK